MKLIVEVRFPSNLQHVIILRGVRLKCHIVDEMSRWSIFLRMKTLQFLKPQFTYFLITPFERVLDYRYLK